MKTGFYIVGVLKGYKFDAFTNRDTGEVRERHLIGIQLQSPDGYGGYNTSIQEIRIDEKCVNDGLKRTITQYKDKLVQILIVPKEWAMEGGRKGITYHFDSNSTIEAINQN